MAKNKFISLLLCIAMLTSVLPAASFAADDADKTQRRVYLHAFDEARSLSDTTSEKEIKRGEPVDVYLAVDDPNKGDENGDKEWENQFDLGGFTVKIYYDTKYFQLVDTSDTTPIEYDLFDMPDWEDGSVEDNLDMSKPEEFPDDYPTVEGYTPLAHGTHLSRGDIDAKWGYAYATILYRGGWLPEDETTKGNWYNILKLPLVPIETGPTSVYIDTSGDDDYTLELFAKNIIKSDVDGDGVDDIERNFKYTAENGGYFYFNIVDEVRPEPPYPDIPQGSYTGERYVKLDALEDGDIYFTTDDLVAKEDFDNYQDYLIANSAGIKIDKNTNLRCYLVRAKDGRESRIAPYRYQILPKAPELFNSKKQFISPSYTEDWSDSAAGYYVYASDSGDPSNPWTHKAYYYYTFSNLDAGLVTNEDDNPYVTNDPAKADNFWCRITANDGKVPSIIDQKRTMRLVAVNEAGHSDVTKYELGVKPGKVYAVPDSTHTSEDSLIVKLLCDAPKDAEIYYTRNDGNPIINGTLYEGELILTYDTRISAVAKYNGEWGEPADFSYQFDSDIIAFYPPGEYEGSVDVSIFPKKEGEKIQVSVDGESWRDYDGAIHLEKDAEIKAKTENSDDVTVLVYDVRPLAPIFAPESTQLGKPEWISIYTPESTKDNTEHYSLRYTTDGSDPRTSETANTATNSQYNDNTDEARIYITGYTEVKAVVVKDGKFSDVVTHTYDVITDRPATPVTTVKPGYHVHEIGGEKIETLFEKVPDGTKIYYTVSNDNAYVPDPDPTASSDGITQLYDENNPIEIKGNTVIKAVAVTVVDGILIKSNIGVYPYTVIPESPVAMPSGEITEYAFIAVDALSGDGCFVEYEINGNPGRFENKDSERFYIDTKTGNVYRTPNPGPDDTPLCRLDLNINTPVNLKIKTELDGVESVERSYVYSVDAQSELDPPYADKQSGEYVESKDKFEVNLYSIYSGDENVDIFWRYEGDETWNTYTAPISFPTEDTILQVMTFDSATNKKSSVVSYVYYFVPPAPVITLPSGVYVKDDSLKTDIRFPADWVRDGYHLIYFQFSNQTEHGTGWGSNIDDIAVNESMSVKAFIKSDSGRISDVVSAYYILQDKSASDGTVWIKEPYSADRIGSHLLGTGLYAEGVKLDRLGTGIIKYQYRYLPVSSESNPTPDWTDWTSVLTYEEISALVPTSRMDKLQIRAWIDGNRDETYREHEIDFIDLGVPTVTLGDNPDSNGNYLQDTDYWIHNAHSDDPNVIVYYTTNGNSPITDKAGRQKFTDAQSAHKLTQTTTVKAVYFSACGSDTCTACGAGKPEECTSINAFYGTPAEFVFPVKTTETVRTGGGGGGTRTVDNTRKYTVDIFGAEHPTHIGYINGYPDGSVCPEGDITREEISAILYRIKPMAYDEPIETTGKVFPDVTLDRWSVREIEHLTAYGIIEGYPDGNFVPGGNLTRAEFAALIRRFIESAEIKTANNKVELSDIGDHWAYDDITFIAKAGLIDGYEDGTFRPDREITRAEVMSVINRILGRKPLESYVKSQDFNPFFDLEDDKWYYVTVLEATITHDYYLNAQSYEYKWENWK